MGFATPDSLWWSADSVLRKEKMKYQDIATGDKDDVYLVTLASVSDPDVEFFTFCKGTSELAMLLLHYDHKLYEFVNAELFCEGNRIFWDCKEVFAPKPKNMEFGDK